MDSYIRNDSKTFSINDVYEADEYFPSFLLKQFFLVLFNSFFAVGGVHARCAQGVPKLPRTPDNLEEGAPPP